MTSHDELADDSTDIEIDTEPAADSYYDRLGIDVGMPALRLKTYGETVLDQFRPATECDPQADYRNLKDAFDVLTDGTDRRVYDEFLEQFDDPAAATAAFELWQRSAATDHNAWLAEYYNITSDQSVNAVYGGTVSDAPTIE